MIVVVAIGWLTVFASAQLSPLIDFEPQIPAGATSPDCYATAPPLVDDPSNVLVSVHCPDQSTVMGGSSKIVHLDLIRRRSEVKWTVNVTGVIFRDRPIPVSQTQALAYTCDSANSVIGLVDTSVATPVWTLDRRNATSGVAYDAQNLVAFVTMGTTSLRAVHALNGTAKWERTFSANASLGTPIFYEGQVLVMHGDSLESIDANSGALSVASANPCGMTAMAGRTLSLALVPFAQTGNGLLSALLLYGMTASGNYSVCRLHHGSYHFGRKEWVHGSVNNLTVDAITGGGGHLFVSTLNQNDNTYQVAVLNATASGDQEVVKMLLNRSSIDRHSYPAVLLRPSRDGSDPIMVLQMLGQLAAYHLFANYSRAWQLPTVECRQHPAVWSGNYVSRAVCVGSAFTTEVDYDGREVWKYRDGTEPSFPAQISYETTVFVQERLSLTGLSFGDPNDYNNDSGDDDDDGDDGYDSPHCDEDCVGFIVLVTVLPVVGLVALVAVIWKVIRVRAARRRAESDGSVGREGYEELNA